MTGKHDPTKIDTSGSTSVSARNGAYARTRVIREYFLTHPGVQVWLMDLREAQKAEGVYENDRYIQQSVANSRAGGMNIEIIMRGQSWVFKPEGSHELTHTAPVPRAPSERLYREKMVTKSGGRLLEDEDGMLFLANELDL